MARPRQCRILPYHNNRHRWRRRSRPSGGGPGSIPYDPSGLLSLGGGVPYGEGILGGSGPTTAPYPPISMTSRLGARPRPLPCRVPPPPVEFGSHLVELPL